MHIAHLSRYNKCLKLIISHHAKNDNNLTETIQGHAIKKEEKRITNKTVSTMVASCEGYICSVMFDVGQRAYNIDCI